jgi:hypothetical protein
MAIQNGGALKSVQKLSQSGVTITAQGSTIKTYAMPSYTVADPANAFVEDVWYRVTSGTFSALLDIFADVTGANEITVVINSPAAQSLTLQIGGRVVELC